MSAGTTEAVYACIRDYPGIHLRGLERALGLSSALVHYHVKQLERAGRIVSGSYGGYTRYFATEASARLAPEDRATLALLREEVALHVALLLLESGSMTQARLAEALDLAKSTVSYHVEKLVQRGLLERDGPALRVRDARRLRRLLTAHAPTPDLRARFRDLWGDFYGGR